MPGVDMSLEELRQYHGSEPEPTDFLIFWKKAMARIAVIDLKIEEEPVIFKQKKLSYSIITVHASDGCVLRAKYIHPADKKCMPTVVQFHDYPGAARSWFHLIRYASVGCAVLAPDCRGQGGMSAAGSCGQGPTAYGPMFNGLEDDIQNMYLYHLIEDALLWIAAAKKLAGIDDTDITVYGEGQGGALALACAAMYPAISVCGAHYPMLCDYRRVWEKDFDVNAYAGLNYYFRWHDPMHEHEADIFKKLGYVDVKNFAPYIQAAVLVSTGLQDIVSPPSAQFAIVNGLNCPNRHAVYPKHGHELNNFFENEWLKFMLERRMTE